MNTEPNHGLFPDETNPNDDLANELRLFKMFFVQGVPDSVDVRTAVLTSGRAFPGAVFVGTKLGAFHSNQSELLPLLYDAILTNILVEPTDFDKHRIKHTLVASISSEDTLRSKAFLIGEKGTDDPRMRLQPFEVEGLVENPDLPPLGTFRYARASSPFTLASEEEKQWLGGVDAGVSLHCYFAGAEESYGTILANVPPNFDHTRLKKISFGLQDIGAFMDPPTPVGVVVTDNSALGKIQLLMGDVGQGSLPRQTNIFYLDATKTEITADFEKYADYDSLLVIAWFALGKHPSKEGKVLYLRAPTNRLVDIAYETVVDNLFAMRLDIFRDTRFELVPRADLELLLRQAGWFEARSLIQLGSGKVLLKAETERFQSMAPMERAQYLAGMVNSSYTQAIEVFTERKLAIEVLTEGAKLALVVLVLDDYLTSKWPEVDFRQYIELSGLERLQEESKLVILTLPTYNLNPGVYIRIFMDSHVVLQGFTLDRLTRKREVKNFLKYWERLIAPQWVPEAPTWRETPEKDLVKSIYGTWETFVKAIPKPKEKKQPETEDIQGEQTLEEQKKETSTVDIDISDLKDSESLDGWDEEDEEWT